MRRRLAILALLVCLAALFPAAAARAAEGEWHSDQPIAAGIGVPAPLGEIGDLKFWAPNRGVLITAGNQGMPAGVYAYDGAGWHLYSTVCGGVEGRIAWAGPDDFWTVSDFATKPEGDTNPNYDHSRTLCHFEGGVVVASYAQPLGTAATYEQMQAAACDAPSNCWFAGKAFEEPAPNRGAFHLHWDGAALTAIPSSTTAQPQIAEPPGAVTGLDFYAGGLYESATEEPFVRQVIPGPIEPFQPVVLPKGPEGPFDLSSSGDQLWAVGTNGATAMRFGALGFEAVPLQSGLGSVEALAAEPGGSAAWVGGAGAARRGVGSAMVRRVEGDGRVGPAIELPGAAEELDYKGDATAMACPAHGQCWLATRKGWLFHLGGALPQDTDPAMHVLITSRPADGSTRIFVPPGLPEDNSGETESSKTGELPLTERFPHSRKRPSLVAKVHQRVVDETLLELSFVLRARAHVRLIAKWHGKAVAHTARLTLGKGPHSIRLRLDPKRWPTGLDFQVHPVAPGKKKS